MWYGIIIGLLALAFCCVCVIAYDMNRFVVARYEVRSRKIRKPYTIVVLSDLHNKSYGRQNGKLLGAILDLSPDCVMAAGDLYTSKAGGGFENASGLLLALAERFPVWMANGNHENKTREHPQAFGGMYERYTERLEAAGLRPLVNEHVIVPEANLDVCGLSIGQEYFRHFRKRRMPERYLEGLIGEPNRNRFQILLAHNPIYFPQYAAWGADLVLSGHMHGGIVRLPALGGVLSPAGMLFPKYDGGRYEEGGSVMLLSRGLGTHSVPVRMWNPGELVVVTLLPAGAEE